MLSWKTPVRGSINGHGSLLPLVDPPTTPMDGRVGGLAQQRWSGSHHRPGGQGCWYQSSYWGLLYLYVASSDSPLVSEKYNFKFNIDTQSFYLLWIQAANGNGSNEGNKANEYCNDQDKNLDPVYLWSRSHLRTSFNICYRILFENFTKFSIFVIVKQVIDFI